MIPEPIRTILDAHKVCHECGTHTVFRQTFCPECGVRIRNRNPAVRLLVTIAALAFVGAVVWWKLKWQR